MPESNSPYTTTTGGSQVLELLRSQLVSVTEDRRRVMLWSAILAVGALMLVGRVASLPWFLSLVPLALLTVWHACLLVRQRRYQAAWDGLLEKAADTSTGTGTGTGPSRKSAAAAAAQATQELGVGSTPAVLGALAAPSVLLFHGLLLAAVVTGGVMHEVQHEEQLAKVVPQEPARGTATKFVSASAPPGAPGRPSGMVPPRNFGNASPRLQPASNGAPAAPGSVRPMPSLPPNAQRGAQLPGAPASSAAPAPASAPASAPGLAPKAQRPPTGTISPRPAPANLPSSPPPPASLAAPKPAAPAAPPAAPKPEAPKPEGPSPAQ